MAHSIRVPCAGVLVLCSSIVSAQAPPVAGLALTPIWNLTSDVAAPESAYYDAASNAVFVSSVNGDLQEKDGNGYISRLTPEGTVVNARWATGLNAPKGLRSTGGTLWVSDIDEVVAIEIATGRITSRVKVEGAQSLNDLATAPDGTAYVSDTAQSRIYMVRDGKSSVFVEGADVVERPNGLLVDGTRLILGTFGPAGPGGRGAGRGPAPPGGRGDAGSGAARGGGARGDAPQGAGRGPGAPGGHLFAFDLQSKQRTQLTTEPVGGIDGIEPDGRGGLLVTDVFGQRLLHVGPGGAVRVIAQFTAAGADFGYIVARQLAIVPFLFGNSVAAYDLTNALK